MIAFSLLFGVSVFAVVLTFYKTDQDGLKYTLLALTMLCFASILANGGIAVLLMDAYATSSQWIQKAAK